MGLGRLLLPPLLLLPGCDGKTSSNTPTSPAVEGAYAVDGTHVNTAVWDPSGAPAGMYSPKRYQTADLVVTALPKSPSTFRIAEVKDGDSFVAELHGDVLEAQNADVVIDPKGNSRAFGIQTRTIHDFRWNLTTGVFRLNDSFVTDVPGGGQYHRFIDTRVDGVGDVASSWVRYRAEANFPWDVAHGAECRFGGSGTAEGFLGLSRGADSSELGVYVQGVGCSFVATSVGGDTFEARDADCPLDPAQSVTSLGIVSWKFESFTLDSKEKRVAFVARATRKRDDGQLMDMCLQVDSSLTGDFPP